MATLIRSGRIVTAVDDYFADILIDGGRICRIGTDLAVGGDVAVHDAAGLLVLPGGVDVHTHLDSATPTATTIDNFGSGTMAAAFGGTTTVVDYCTPLRGQSPLRGLEDWHRRRESACVDVGAHMILLDAEPGTLQDMKTLVQREGISSFKFFMAYPGALMVDDGALLTAMRVAGANGALSCVHAENGPAIQALIRDALARGQTAPRFHALTRPALLEGEAAQRAIHLAALADAPLYVVHLSTAQALAAVADARQRGLRVHAETCPQYLFLNAEEYERPGFEAAKFVMSPPLREPCHPPQLLSGLERGDIEVVATDHCAFCFDEQPHGLRFSKQLGTGGFNRIPNGAPGIETRLSLVYDGAVLQRRMSLNRFVDVTATAPAKLFGLFPKKGTVAVGSDADLVLFDPGERWTVRTAEHHSRSDYTLYEGRELTGKVQKVFLRGHCIVDGANWLGQEGAGQFLRRAESGRS
ncbi:MAG: dihydropyrimidinase [Caldimonas sp.]